MSELVHALTMLRNHTYFSKEDHRCLDIIEARLKDIEAYCVLHNEFMWAAHIWSIITDKEFREIARPTATSAGAVK